MLRIRKDDKVKVLVGKDKGKIGKVMRVFPKENRLLVEKINIVKKARRRTQQDQQGGFVEREAAIHISNVMLIDRKTNEPTRFSASFLKDGSKQRISKKSAEGF